METLTLTTPIRFVAGVGPSIAGKLAKLGIETVEDLLYHFPFRYNDFSLTSDIGQVQPGEVVTIAGTVQTMKAFITKMHKRIQEAQVADETGKLSIIWFNQPYLVKLIKPGDLIRLSGKVDWFGRKIVMTSPVYELAHGEGNESSIHTGRLVSVYPETEGLTSKWIRAKIHALLPLITPLIQDPLPHAIKTTYALMDLPKALDTIHFPNSQDDARLARHRLAFDELFLLQLIAYLKRREWETTKQAYELRVPKEDITSLLSQLPFDLTGDQQQATQEILADLAKSIPMNRLLEGDVGSGKTVVAAIAMYVAFRNDFQTVLMAPTQILAEQHYQTIRQLFEPLGIPVHIMTSEKKTFPNHEATSGQASLLETNSKAAVIVGTHALLAENVTLTNVGLVVIDEQHRFGVEQRAKLLGDARGRTPHLLTMTATPIPRTVAKTIFGNLDLSVLAESPKGRQRIKTWVVPTEKRTDAYSWIAKQIALTHGQVYVVCPLIEESDNQSEVKAATAEFERLKQVFPALTLGLLHGRLKPAQKTAVLDEFKAGKIQLLVATPVVEVGIDVPKATIMLIEAADRFGLGQLHQLRGRVGRSTLQSYCLLFTESDEDHVFTRLKSLEKIHSGPLLADLDLTLRGPGELFGTRQHGVPDLRLASLTDNELIQTTKHALQDITSADADLAGYPLLRERVKKGTIEAVEND